MFTGIISEIGEVKKIFRDKENTVFTIAAKKSCVGLKLGDSIAINGSCHTVIRKSAGSFSVESMPETLKRTNLGELKICSKVNLEKPLKASGSLDGHFVSGHIDGVAKIISITPDKNSKIFTLEIPKDLSKLVVEKGSIALDGISLTVISIRGDKITVGIIPHTLKFTTLGLRKAGDKINVEADLLAKHLAKLVGKK
ncbi:MAG: riboflavin synthase [Candidatus Gracilibacteria bacterium]|jgi:riboflavin synthase|nr:riboflavin synthase [Candidatus Gracilibacteria bacterium]MDD5178825.1 riboflavin synthase [Candidatus Gracilibacteria bacterium]